MPNTNDASQNTNDNVDTEKLNKQLADLLIKAKKVNENIDKINKSSREETSDISSKIDKEIVDIDKICDDLDAKETETKEKLNALMLEQLQDIDEDNDE